MKVLQFGKHFPPATGGIETVMLDLVDGLAGRGIDCDVLCSNHASRTVEEDRGRSRIVRAGSLGIVASTALSPALVVELCRRAARYDIIHVHTPDPMATLALFVARPRARVLVHWHNDIVRQKLAKHAFAPLQRWLLDRADLVVASTPPYLESSPDLARVRHKAVAIAYGTDSLRLRPDAQRAAEIRRRHGGRRIVLALGRLVPQKGFEHLVRAARSLDDSYAIVIAGRGPLEASLREAIARDGVASRVELVGFVPDADLGSWYEACDVFCLPSVERSEAFGIVQLEAMALGRPVVATTIPGSGTAWVNAEGESGLNVAPGDAAALAGAIRAIVEDRVVWERYSEGARRRYARQFTREAMAHAFEARYRALLSA